MNPSRNGGHGSCFWGKWNFNKRERPVQRRPRSRRSHSSHDGKEREVTSAVTEHQFSYSVNGRKGRQPNFSCHRTTIRPLRVSR